MTARTLGSPLSALAALLGATLIGFLVLPIVALAWSTSATDVRAAFAHPMFASSLGLSLRTTVVSVAVTVGLGTPLAWWMASSSSGAVRVVSTVVNLPIIIPPAVIGVALLQTFGRRGLLGPGLQSVGLEIPFTANAVIIAQVVDSSPFYVQAATAAFRKVDRDMLLVARTLGATPAVAFFRIALPIARPGLITGVSLAWARALGEFGATLLFAGNLRGRTQTMPLAIYSALETDVRIAVVFALCLALMGAGLLLLFRLVSAPRSGPGFGPNTGVSRPLADASRPKDTSMDRPPARSRTSAPSEADPCTVPWRASVRGPSGPLTMNVHIDGPAAVVALIGPNGSGKTTFLRALAGAVDIPHIELEVGGRVLAGPSSGRSVPVERRRLGYLPQGYALFPHLSVIDNVAFGLSVGDKVASRAERQRRARGLLTELGCEALIGRPIRSLSGGEQQRVALARALAVRPTLLLLDEPLSALDIRARSAVRRFLAERLRAFDGPCVIVTHDVRDIVALDATVVAIEQGHAVQQEPLAELRRQPATDFVAEFVGFS